MPITMRNPYDAPEPSNNMKLFINVLLLSLLAHATLIVFFLLANVFTPIALLPTKKEPPTVSLSLVAPPPPPKQIFVPTNPEQNAPHKVLPIISANDHDLTSQSKVARKPDSIMPDVNGKERSPDLNSSPEVQAPPKPEIASTPPTPRQAKPDKPTPPQPKPQTAQAKPQPEQPPAKPKPPTPPQKVQPLVDDNGLPLLPAINAPTLAPPDSSPPPAAPTPSQRQQATSVHGSLGRAGDNSPAAMATELGKYKQYVYNVVGSYWYPDIDKHFGIIPVGMVHIKFTIHSDGTLTDVAILEGDNLEQLKLISKHALVAPAPFKAFSPAMIKEVGDSYTDDFSFSVY